MMKNHHYRTDVFINVWRHFTLSYVMMCNGAGFKVKKATNFNFLRDFSIAMTFSASNVTNTQGLLYKITGSEHVVLGRH